MPFAMPDQGYGIGPEKIILLGPCTRVMLHGAGHPVVSKHIRRLAWPLRPLCLQCLPTRPASPFLPTPHKHNTPMNNPVSRRILFKTAIALVALALPSAAWSQAASDLTARPLADKPHEKKTHTITISYADGVWNYSVYPAQANPLKTKVKRGDTLNWICSDGRWTVFFKNGATPLVDENGNPISTLNGASGTARGATIGAKPKDHDSFSYGVRVEPNGGGEPVVDDPEIIIES